MEESPMTPLRLLGRGGGNLKDFQRIERPPLYREDGSSTRRGSGAGTKWRKEEARGWEE